MKEIKSDFYNFRAKGATMRAFLIIFLNSHIISTKHELEKNNNKINSSFCSKIEFKINFGKSVHKNFTKYLLKILSFMFLNTICIFSRLIIFFLSFVKHSGLKKNISERLLTFLFEND